MDQYVRDFNQFLQESPDLPIAVNAIRTLVKLLQASKATTMMELRDQLQELIQAMVDKSGNSTLSLSSGCQLFMSFGTRAESFDSVEHSKVRLIERAKIFIQKATDSRKKIATLGNPFIRDGATILTHSRSRVVEKLLLEAAAANKRISVFMTESRPDGSGYIAAEQLRAAGIPVTMILDAAVGHIIGKVDLVLVGAEGVVESGGIVNKIGTYQLAIVAKVANKPFYAVAESFKFVRMYPLSQYDLPVQSDNAAPFYPSIVPTQANSTELKFLNPSVDYTPPAYISLLFTDLGVLTPSAVSDQLILLYT
ncbi:translation initiation factor eIF-2B subunit alpha [Capsaspora owczarzaki ATCC 30864]|uniref:Translation initiation factor eIF2B subunit alpha n=1 Tax=Capsaspora owczarzaki (strain ATCC 30864) TaxID=595528 RepID=A0A0D2VQY7_CAPO3|nr:translation initiation factor eIF-2B subunit alpha [Capsaspora owczarzaki ATCC 30864]KJE93227.1 translation initiation factor eIF-2B subunit alpha [Capsaspora owczarzaki ATCC 30864]|eukprot:XP_004347870.1 translation initiation factor eIF-2B subunit alpha [Capsaspora owczarzaki ATCC 30864]